MLRKITKWISASFILSVALVPVLKAKTDLPVPNVAQTSSNMDGKVDEATKKALIKQVQDYLNSVRSLKARFSQSDPKSGNLYQGSLVLRRGGKIRVQYDLPYGLIMVGNGGELRYYDQKMDKVNSTSTDSTPLGTLLLDTVDFEKDMKVLDIRKTFGTIRMLVTKEGIGNGGYLVLVFSDNPIALRQWVVMDQKQNQINFSLINPVYNDPVEENNFDLNSVKKRL
jgi:outer membrane lipoprotein-sorting protein